MKTARDDARDMELLVELTPRPMRALCAARLARAASTVGLLDEAGALAATAAHDLTARRRRRGPRDLRAEALACRGPRRRGPRDLRAEALACLGLVQERLDGPGAGAACSSAAVELASAEPPCRRLHRVLDALAECAPSALRARLARRAWDALSSREGAWTALGVASAAPALAALGLGDDVAAWSRGLLRWARGHAVPYLVEALAAADAGFPAERDLALVLDAAARVAAETDEHLADVLAPALARADGAAERLREAAHALDRQGQGVAARWLRVAALGVDARREVPGRGDVLEALLAEAEAALLPRGRHRERGFLRMRTLARLLPLVPLWLEPAAARDALLGHVELARVEASPYVEGELLQACVAGGARLAHAPAALEVAGAALAAVEDRLSRRDRAPSSLAEAAAPALELAARAGGRDGWSALLPRADRVVVALDEAAAEAHGDGSSSEAACVAHWAAHTLAGAARSARLAGDEERAYRLTGRALLKLRAAGEADVVFVVPDLLPAVAPGEAATAAARRRALRAILGCAIELAGACAGAGERQVTWEGISGALSRALVTWHGRGAT